MRKAGLEPASLAALAPKASVFAISPLPHGARQSADQRFYKALRETTAHPKSIAFLRARRPLTSGVDLKTVQGLLGGEMFARFARDAHSPQRIDF